MGNKKKKKPSGFVTAVAAVGGAALMVTYSIGGAAVALRYVDFDENGNIVGFKTSGKSDEAKETASMQDGQEMARSEAEEEVKEAEEATEHSIEQKQRFKDKEDASGSDTASADKTTAGESKETESEETKSKETESEEIKDEKESQTDETQASDMDEQSGVVKPSAVERRSTDNAGTVAGAAAASTVVSDVTAVVKAAMPCVVSITNEALEYDYWYDEMVEGETNASGIIIGQNDEELLIATNYHVVENSLGLYVQFADSSEATAYIKGTSPEDDLAVVSVFLDDIADDTLDSIAIAVLGDSDKLEVGEPAIAIGNSLGYGQSVTTGIISALDREIYDENDEYGQGRLIQTDAAINPGSSGGALLNSRGEVIGINSSKIADYVIEGMGYAIPISSAKPVIDELVKLETRKKVEESQRGFLGISGVDVTEDAMGTYDMPEGVFVKSIVDNSAADKAGITKGDIITELNGEPVGKMQLLQNLLEYYAAGENMEVTIERFANGEYDEKHLDVTLGSKVDMED